MMERQPLESRKGRQKELGAPTALAVQRAHPCGVRPPAEERSDEREVGVHLERHMHALNGEAGAGARSAAQHEVDLTRAGRPGLEVEHHAAAGGGWQRLAVRPQGPRRVMRGLRHHDAATDARDRGGEEEISA